MADNKIKVSSVYGEMRVNSLYELIGIFQTFNREKGISYGFGKGEELSAVIVYKQSNFTREYSETERSYRVTSQGGKRFFEGMLGGSMYGDCLDGRDLGVRLDAYNWDIERIYLEGSINK